MHWDRHASATKDQPLRAVSAAKVMLQDANSCTMFSDVLLYL